MSGDAHLLRPSARGRLRGLVARVIGRLAAFLGTVRPSALALPARKARVDRAIRDRESPRTPSGQFAPARSGRPPTPPSPRGRVRLRGARGAPFSTVRVGPEFSPRDYRATFAALQEPTGSKLLDLVPARLLCADLFEELAGAWTVGPETVPRLGIVVPFERWVMHSEAVLAQLAPVAARGVRVGVFYAEQASDGYLCEWFTRGWIVHNVRGAIATLAARWPRRRAGGR